MGTVQGAPQRDPNDWENQNMKSMVTRMMSYYDPDNYEGPPSYRSWMDVNGDGLQDLVSTGFQINNGDMTFSNFWGGIFLLINDNEEYLLTVFTTFLWEFRALFCRNSLRRRSFFSEETSVFLSIDEEVESASLFNDTLRRSNGRILKKQKRWKKILF